MNKNKQDKNDEKPNWRNFALWFVGTLLLVAIFFVIMPEQIPSRDDPRGYPCCSAPDTPEQIAENLTEQGYVLYIYGSCYWCDKQIEEFGDYASDLVFVDCRIAHQAYRFENLSEAEKSYNWLYLNGSQIKVTNLTYENRTIRYDGYGILGYSNKNPVCALHNISGYPTWVAPNGTHIVGYRSLDDISGWLD